MLFGIAELVLLGLLFDWIARKIKLPGLIGLLLLGVIVGPHAFNLLNPETQSISQELRLLALIVILLRAGFEMSREALSKVGIRAVLMSFIPCMGEVAIVTVVAPMLLPLNYLESAMLGSVLAAVSPAVVVPLMIQFIEAKRGAKNGAPTLVLAGASCDDAVAIVLCSSFVGMYVGSNVNVAMSIAHVPLSIVLGVGAGLLLGLILHWFFVKFNPRATKRLLILLGLAVLLIHLQQHIESVVPYSALLTLMAIGFIILEKDEHVAHEISSKLGKLWIFAQLLLFALVGAQVNLPIAMDAGLAGIAIVFVGLIGRSVGVQLSLMRSHFSWQERVFINLSYLPKATVQAAIGGVPLAAMAAAGMATAAGELILAMAVLSIVLTAPLGAFLISWAGKKWLPISVQETSAQLAAFESE